MGKGNSFKAIINEQAACVNSEGKNLSDCRSNRRLLIAMNRKDGLSYLLPSSASVRAIRCNFATRPGTGLQQNFRFYPAALQQNEFDSAKFNQYYSCVTYAGKLSGPERSATSA